MSNSCLHAPMADRSCALAILLDPSTCWKQRMTADGILAQVSPQEDSRLLRAHRQKPQIWLDKLSEQGHVADAFRLDLHGMSVPAARMALLRVRPSTPPAFLTIPCILHSHSLLARCILHASFPTIHSTQT